MFKRIIVAVVLLPVLFLIIYVFPVISLPIALGIISAIAIYEALCATNFLKHSRVALYSMILAFFIPFWVYEGSDLELAMAGLFVYVLCLFGESIYSRNTLGLERLGGAFFLSVFIPLFLSAFIRMRQEEQWRLYIILPFAIAFLSDAFALFAGLLFGKHKLAPDLSPKKTVEGSIGGLLGAVASAMVCGLVFETFFQVTGVRYPVLALYGFLGSIVSQMGDLSFSCIKREYGIKDFGDLLPGHGGILDRFDSVIFCAPLVEVLLYFLPVVK